MRRLAFLYDALIGGMAALSGLIIVGTSFWVTYDVVMRYLFTKPTIWADDLSEYGLVWVVFLAAPWVLRREGHVRIELLIEKFSKRHQQQVAVASSIIGAVVFAFYAWRTGLTTWEFYERGLMVARNWAVPVWVTYVMIPVGSMFLAIEFILRAYRYARPVSSRSTRDIELH